MPNPETTERTEEYRVVGENECDEQWEYDCGANRAEAERRAKELRGYGWNRWVRIQACEVTRGPWVDLDEGEGLCIGCGESGGDHAIDCERGRGNGS